MTVLSQNQEFQAGDEHFGAQGAANANLDAGLEQKTWKGGEKPKCKNNIDRNMRDCEEEEFTWNTETIIGAAVTAVLFVLGLVLGVLDYCWAPQDNKLAPRCQKPDGWGDFLLAVIGFPIKLFFVVVVMEPVLASIMDDAISFVYHLFLLGCASVLMSTLCLPVTLWYSPTLKEIRQKYTHEKKEINVSKMNYVKSNFTKFLKCIFFAPCKLFIPWVFVATGKALFVVVFAEILFGMSTWCYVLFRVGLSACTYKLFTVKGWLQEIKDCMEIKKRVMALDYPRFNPPEAQQEQDGGAGAVAGKAAMAVKDAGVAGATDKASSLVILGWCPFMSLITVSFSIFCDLFADFAFGFLLQFVLVGFAIYIAEKVLEERKENSVPEPSTPIKSGANDERV
jgi:hypothetical protein